MRIIKVPLQAGVESGAIAIKGHNFRALEADAPFTLTFDTGITTEFLAGLGIRVPDGFTNVRLLSDVDQTIEFIAGDGFIDDNRLAGIVNVQGLVDTREVGAGTATSFGIELGVFDGTETINALPNTRSVMIQCTSGKLSVGFTPTFLFDDGIEVNEGSSFTTAYAGDVYVKTDEALSKFKVMKEFS